MSWADQRADPDADRKTRWTAAGVVAVIHFLLLVGLIRAFTPQFAATVVNSVTSALTVTVTTAPLDPASPEPVAAPRIAAEQAEGAAGAPGKKAVPRDSAVPKAQIAVKPITAPPVAGPGTSNASGAREDGEGTGAAGTGVGSGSGAGGTGQGGGGSSSPTVKIRGDINSAKDYPRESRDLRIGASVTIDLTIGVDGLVKACRVVQPSPDPAADRITCELATRRFRFKAASDARGEPVQATYRWRQRWFY